jgi:hypothetical protein
VPTRIIFVVAPINAVLNYALGTWLSFLPPLSHILNFTLRSVGPTSHLPRLYRRPDCHRNLLQPCRLHVSHLRDILRAPYGLASIFETDLYEFRGVGTAGLGRGWLVPSFYSSFSHHLLISKLMFTGQTASEWWAWELISLAASL